MTKPHMQRFIAKMVVTLPPGEIIAKTGAVLAGLHRKTAARTPDGVLTAVKFWLPFVDSFRTELTTHSEEIFILFGMFPQEDFIDV